MNEQIIMNSSTAKVKISAKDRSYGQDVRNELEQIAEVSDYRLEISHDYLAEEKVNSLKKADLIQLSMEKEID